jgi:predicted RNA-binding Zn-ribbon protein involved in translation (DUF1610 family)
MESTPKCPACSAIDLRIHTQGSFECPYCGTIFSGKPTLCPSCGNENSFSSQKCTQCGEPLTMFARVVTRHGSRTNPLRLQQMRGQAARLKESEAIASQRRMDVFLEVDRRREQALHEAQEASKAHDRKIIKLLFVLTASFFALLICVVAWRLLF